MRVTSCASQTGIAVSFPGSLLSGMAETVTQTCSRKERPQTLGGTVEAIDEDPLDLVRRLLLRRSALKLAIGPGRQPHSSPWYIPDARAPGHGQSSADTPFQ